MWCFVLIFSNNSVGEEYRDVEDAVPYRFDRIVFAIIGQSCNRGFISSTGERCSPLHIHCVVICVRFACEKIGQPEP